MKIMIGRQLQDRLARWFPVVAVLAVAVPGFSSPHVCSTRSMEAATRAVRDAEAAVARAAKSGALWLNAEQALERARAALAQHDPGQAACSAMEASSFAALGIEQLHYPSYPAISGDQP